MKKCKNITFCHFFAFGGPCDVQKWVKVYKVYVSWKPCLYSLRRHQKKWFLSIWGRTRCNRSAQGLKMANCTSFKILTHMYIEYVPCKRPPFLALNFHSRAYHIHRWQNIPLRSITILYFLPLRRPSFSKFLYLPAVPRRPRPAYCR